jgi:hypothetical protein
MLVLKRYGVVAALLCLLLSACSSTPSPDDKIGGIKIFSSTEQGYDQASIKDPAWKPPVSSRLPNGSRVGLMVALDNEIALTHAGTLGRGDFRRTLIPSFDLPGYVTESLRKRILSGVPYQPVLIRPSARLLRYKSEWQKSWNGKSGSFGDWQAEFDAIIKQNRLQMLIVVSPYELDDGVTGTSQTLRGNGLYNRSGLGKTQNAAFSTIRFHRIVGSPGKLQAPVEAPGERLYAEIPGMPNDIPEPFTKPLQFTLEKNVKALIDQKADSFIALLKQ